MKKLLRAYHTEFKPTENVLLVLLTHAYHSTNQFEKEIAVYLREQGLLGKGPPYTVLTGLPQTLLPSLYSLADVLAIPSHGEGWGRPHVEAMSCGTPVIATAWSGPTAFVTEDNGYPLRVAADLIPTPGWAGHRWADPDETHLRTLLRRVHATPDEARAKGAQAREDMVARFSLQALAAQVDEEVRRIRVSEPYQVRPWITVWLFVCGGLILLHVSFAFGWVGRRRARACPRGGGGAGGRQAASRTCNNALPPKHNCSLTLFLCVCVSVCV